MAGPDGPQRPLAATLRLPCGVVIPNRIAKCATSEHMGDAISGEPTDELCSLYRRWAGGGSGLLITGNVMVDPRYLEGPKNLWCGAAGPVDEAPASWRAWAAACHAGGESRPSPIALVQLSHPGRQCPPSVLGLGRPPAPSAVSFRLPGVGLQLFRCPRALEPREVEELPGKFANAAALAVAAGFDGVQVHAAHGYLLSQFLSPHTNRRCDGWGGDEAQRRRLLLEVVKETRLAIGPGRVLSVKVNSRDFRAGGLTEEQAMGVIAALRATGAVDLIEVSGGTYEHMACMAGSEEGLFLGFARRIRAELPGLPVVTTGGFRTYGRCSQAVAEGGSDMVGLVRPLCLEPDLPARWLAAPDASEVEEARVDVRIRTPLFSSLLVPGLGYFWHQKQLQRLGMGLEAEPLPTAASLARILLVTIIRAYIWEPRRPGAWRVDLRALGALGALGALAAAVVRRRT